MGVVLFLLGMGVSGCWFCLGSLRLGRVGCMRIAIVYVTGGSLVINSAVRSVEGVGVWV